MKVVINVEEQMLASLTLLFVCQIIGEAIVRGAGVPLPGPVVGMLLLFLMLRLKLPLPSEVMRSSDGLLKFMPLLFVPAGVGAIQFFDRIGTQGLRVVGVVILSTVISLTVTALTFAGIARVCALNRSGVE